MIALTEKVQPVDLRVSRVLNAFEVLQDFQAAVDSLVNTMNSSINAAPNKPSWEVNIPSSLEGAAIASEAAHRFEQFGEGKLYRARVDTETGKLIVMQGGHFSPGSLETMSASSQMAALFSDGGPGLRALAESLITGQS